MSYRLILLFEKHSATVLGKSGELKYIYERLYDMKSYSILFILTFCLFIGTADAQQLKILSYNIFHAEQAYNRGESSIRELADLINTHKPDFVALQEVDSVTNRLKKINNSPHDLIKELARLTGMYGHFGKTINYDDGGYGLGLLSKNPSIAEKVMLPMPSGGEPRAALSIKHQLPNGKEVVFGSIHLSHETDSNRIAQTNMLGKHFKRSKLPVILAGDFNFQPDTKGYNQMLKKYQDAAKLSGSPEPTFPGKGAKSRIDYVFLSRNAKWKVIKSEVLQVKYSDHLPLLVTVELIK